MLSTLRTTCNLTRWSVQNTYAIHMLKHHRRQKQTVELLKQTSTSPTPDSKASLWSLGLLEVRWLILKLWLSHHKTMISVMVIAWLFHKKKISLNEFSTYKGLICYEAIHMYHIPSLYTIFLHFITPFLHFITTFLHLSTQALGKSKKQDGGLQDEKHCL